MPNLKRKGPLQKLLDEQMARIPQVMARKLVDEKLEALDIDDGVLADLLVRLLTGDRSKTLKVQINARAKKDITIRFDSADLKRIEKFSDDLSKRLPKMVEKVTQQVSKTMLADYKAAWAEYRPHEIEYFDQFKRNLQTRWGKGLDGLRVLLQMCRDIGEEYLEAQLPAGRKRRKYKAEALAALHVRACQVTSEIICLMENGYADGAIARWRTLHEISVIATLIGDGDNVLAQRYLAHEAIDEKRAMDTFEASRIAEGYGPLAPREKRTTVAAYERALRKFGPEFGGHFGWAAGYFDGNKSPKFIHLQEAAGRASVQPDYKMASYNVHASASGLFQRLSASIGSTLMVAGASNAGLAEPGQFTAYSLVQITGQLFGEDWDADQIASVSAIVRLRDEIPRMLSKAEAKLRRDEMRAEIVRARRAQVRLAQRSGG